MAHYAEALEFEFAFKAPDFFQDAYYFVFHDTRILAEQGEPSWRPLDLARWKRMGLEARTELCIGRLFGIPCFAVELVTNTAEPSGFTFISLWELVSKIDNARFAVVGRASQILDWERTHQYCGKCGQPTQVNDHERSRTCQACNLTVYPKLSPAIIVLVTKGDELLLARGPRMREGFYSTLAGFVEPGESVEQAVHREVFEEVGIKIKNLQYYDSQPWPFPNSLMLGYFAEYESGELVLQEGEILEAQWFPYHNLPHHPRLVSISGWLIEDFVKRKMAGE